MAPEQVRQARHEIGRSRRRDAVERLLPNHLESTRVRQSGMLARVQPVGPLEGRVFGDFQSP